MRRDEDSEEEVFERRRKIQKKKEEVQGRKDEIEDLFAEEASDTTEEEEIEDEPVRWALGSAGSTETLREVFGDGSEYAGVLNALAAARSGVRKEGPGARVSGEAAPSSFSEAPVLPGGLSTPSSSLAPSNSLCDGTARASSRSRLAERVRRLFPTVPGSAVDDALEAVEQSEGPERDKACVAAAKELFPHMDTAHTRSALLQIEEVLRAHRDAEKARAWAAHALEGADTPLARFAKQALDALGSAEECARAVPWALGGKGHDQAKMRGEMALSAKIAGVPWIEEADRMGETDQTGDASTNLGAGETRTARSNPWLFRAALDAALEGCELAVWSTPDAAPVILSSYFPGTPLVLRMLERRGVRWSVRLDPAQVAEKAGADWCADAEEAAALQVFVAQAEKELARAAQREIVRRAEKHVQSAVFERVLGLASMHAGRHKVAGAWVAHGRVKWARADAHGSKPERVEELGEEERVGMLAVTGTGSRVRALLQRQRSVYVPEGVLALGGAGSSADLAGALCEFARHPLLGLQRALAAEKALPEMAPLESLLGPGSVRSAWKHALWVAQAQKEVANTSEFAALRKHLLKYLKSGGCVQALPVGVGATAEDARRAVRSAAAPHTGWRDLGRDVAAESPVLQLAYLRCVARLRGEAVLPPALGAREEFAAAAGVSEADVFGLETRWALSSACVVSLPGRVAECVVCRTGAECVVQMESGVYAVVEGAREAAVGQRMRVQVQHVDFAQQRVTVRAVEPAHNGGLRDAGHWRVKKMGAGSAVRALREKPLGAHVFRASATHRDSLMLTVRMTEYPDECVCAHLRVRERPEGYEVEGRMYASLDAVADEFLPGYTRVLRQVAAHPRFTMSSVESMKQAVARRSVPCALSISRTANSCVSFVRPASEGGAPEEVLLYVTDRGVVMRGRLFPTIDSACSD